MILTNNDFVRIIFFTGRQLRFRGMGQVSTSRLLMMARLLRFTYPYVYVDMSTYIYIIFFSFRRVVVNDEFPHMFDIWYQNSTQFVYNDVSNQSLSDGVYDNLSCKRWLYMLSNIGLHGSLYYNDQYICIAIYIYSIIL